MSGGVDSSVTAALLKEQGHDVVGITLQLYDHDAAVGRKGACCAGDDIDDARRVAEGLDIPHYVLDYESRFQDQVIEDFADSYLRGETPVPCIRCNQTVKFSDLMQTARDLGASALATGHYVRRVEGGQGPELNRGADPVRDQSYFLFATTRDQLEFLRFPLGDLSKDGTRALAARLGLPVAQKADSQDICFVPKGGYAGVIEKLRPGAAEAGDIVDLAGEVLGRHQGTIHYTVGQRRGLGVSATEPLYVVRIEPDRRRVVVGPRHALLVRCIQVGDVNWLGPGDGPADGMEVAVKVRSTRPPVPARLHPRSEPTGGVEVELIAGEEGVARGQACVFYNGDRVLGGGWIAGTGVAETA
jgi:tRNA-specific 2-thiouridylase